MFRQLALLRVAPPVPPGTTVTEDDARKSAEAVFDLHPIQLARFLEEVWAGRNTSLTVAPTGLEIPTGVPQLALERDSGIPVPRWIAVAGATGGDFTLSYTRPGTTTATTMTLNFDASADAVRIPLEGVLGAGAVTVTGGPLPVPIGVTFNRPLDAANLAVTANALTGPAGTTPRLIVTQYPPSIWDHLIYAYMIENTRVYEIFQRVLEEYAYGERLSFPSAASQRWLRTTEQLFYRDGPPFGIGSLTSWVKDDMRKLRRNAYQRVFGLDLNHGTDDNRPYPYPRAAAANIEFTGTFEELLREVWRAIENVRNQVGPNQTDVTTIANLARALYDMLRARRQEGSLGRDEFVHVATMDWFHLTVSFNTPIVVDLKSEAPSPAERLEKIGQRVGLPAHSRSDSYFFLAESMSLVLRELELGTFNDPTRATALFQGTATQPSVFQDAMQQIITHWSIATGRDVKRRPVTVTTSPPPPVRPTPAPIVTPRPARNGRQEIPA